MDRKRFAVSVLVCLASVISGPRLFAQDLFFANDVNLLKDVSVLKVPSKADEIPVFKGGDAVFGVFRVNGKNTNLTQYTVEKKGARAFRIIWSYYNSNKTWEELSSLEIPLTVEQLKKNNFPFTLVPDTYDLNAPGFQAFISKISDLKAKVFFKVRLENLADFYEPDKEFFSQSAFYIDMSAGAGRYAEWKQNSVAYANQQQQAKDSAACAPARDGQLTKQFGYGELYSLAFSPDGKVLASGRQGGIKLWDFETGKELASFAQAGGVFSVAFDATGTLLASVGSNRCIVLWDISKNKSVLRLREEDYRREYLYSVRFSPDGKTLLTGSNRVRLWDVASGALKQTAPLDDLYQTGLADFEYGHVYAVFSPNGKTIAVVDSHGDGPDGKVSIFETETLKLLGSLRGYSKAILSVAVSPDGKMLASGSEDGTFKLWDLSTATEPHPFSRQSGLVESVAFSPNGTVVAAGSIDAIRLWDVATGKELQNMRPNTRTTAVVFSPDGKSLVSGGYNGIINVWDPGTGKLVRMIPAETGLILR